ncbi:hypothetical protein BCR34DRAFT_555243 [Clohesyomyces aquaticus]|uniref:Uncharacterized protein n=1 Tax=Clohesyomyces aquaticus TaxID=1231657 RepID=A0A1Y2A558_9PLEO|nr:hypothetical protein BCR34DRAFT_555243 [Clohesyomyces aquaticus]
MPSVPVQSPYPYQRPYSNYQFLQAPMFSSVNKSSALLRTEYDPHKSNLERLVFREADAAYMPHPHGSPH